MKTNHVTIEIDNSTPMYTENFKETVDKWSDYNQIHFKRLYADDLIKLKLRDFEMEYRKVIVYICIQNRNISVIYVKKHSESPSILCIAIF